MRQILYEIYYTGYVETLNDPLYHQARIVLYQPNGKTCLAWFPTSILGEVGINSPGVLVQVMFDYCGSHIFYDKKAQLSVN